MRYQILFSGASPVIAKSDFVILLISLSALGGGVYRWQNSIGTAPAITIPASLQSSVRNPVDANRADASSTVAASEATTERLSVNTTSPRIVNEPEAPTTIVVNGESVGVAPSVASDVPANNAGLTNNSVTSNSVTSSGPLFGEHEVVYGDYLCRIANDYGTSVNEIRRIDNLSGSNIFVGQKLKYPLPAN